MPRKSAKPRDRRASSIADTEAVGVSSGAHSTAAPAPTGSGTEVPNSFESPESSSVAGASYNFETQQMRVRLLRVIVTGAPPDEKSYAYEGVPPHLWADFVAAASKGQFFNARVRPIFVGRKL